jgi:hypothetical protein
MADHLKKQFSGYMTACYGQAWAMRIPSDQIAETEQAFYMGALAYQGLVLNTLNPGAGPTTPEEEARGERLFGELMEEIETFGRGRIFELFEKATSGGGRA